MSQNLGRTRSAYQRLWHHASLANPSTPPLGRLASRIAIILTGKHKPTWDPSTDCGDYVVATDCAQLFVTGKKMKLKQYYSHSTRPGHLKQVSMEALMAKWGGGEVLRRAVRGMLPKNRLRDVRLDRLKVFEGPHHPYKRTLTRLDGTSSNESYLRDFRQALVEADAELPLPEAGTPQRPVAAS